MEKKTPSVIKLVAALAVGGVFWALDRFVISHSILKVIAMAALVLFCAGLISLILGVLKPASHRARTVLTLLASLTRYLAAIVILCWGLSIFGVNVNTIVASVGIVALVVGFGAITSATSSRSTASAAPSRRSASARPPSSTRARTSRSSITPR